jgi:single-strand DNA-binding protein
MTMYASIHGRAGNDPLQSTTKSGKAMTRCSVAVNAAGFNAETEETVWITILAFSRSAEDLARAAKGQMVTAQGKLTRGRFTGKDGLERESWSLMADAVLVAASARPTGKARRPDTPSNGGTEAPHRGQDPGPFDDEIPF